MTFRDLNQICLFVTEAFLVKINGITNIFNGDYMLVINKLFLL